MASVTGRINAIKQPYGGYIKPSEFLPTTFDDGITLDIGENIHGIIIGLAVDYLTRFVLGTDLKKAFDISLRGAGISEFMSSIDGVNVATELLSGIKGLDDYSITNACKLVTFDVWLRNPNAALFSSNYKETNPNKQTIQNIKIMVDRSLCFFEKYGPITKNGFTFEENGYTATVSSGDGDFLTSDTLWDFKVSKSKPKKEHTLQLLMYWIMGQHSGQDIFKTITKLGIFNPRLNTVYLLNVSNIPSETIKIIENDVICY